MPGQIERVADYLGVSLPVLFRDSLDVREGWPVGSDEAVLVPVPATTSGQPAWHGGRCVFLSRGRCAIHAVKPFECAQAWCADGQIPYHEAVHHGIVEAWNTPEGQQQLASLRDDADAR